MRKIEKSEVLRLIAGLQFREFTRMDRITFQGCDSENPMVAETDDLIVILDGEAVCFLANGDDVPSDSDCQLFFLNELIDGK